MGKTYRVEATLYTGVVSGYSLEGTGTTDWAATNNEIDNLINIIRSENTLKRVSYRLYARNMINGNLDADNQYITAANFKEIYYRTKNNKDGKTLLSLINKDSEEETVKNLLKYERPTPDNFVYGLFYWNHIHYSYNALKNIHIVRKGNSDLLEISYATNDPGIAYNTMELLMEEFVNEYRNIRYGETDKVIEYFRQELARVGKVLRLSEDSLTAYNIEKRVVNYYDETKELAAISKEFEFREQNITMEYKSSRAMLDELESQLDENLKALKTNSRFISSLNRVSELTGRIAEIESFSTADAIAENTTLSEYKNDLLKAQEDLNKYSEMYVDKSHTKEGLSKMDILHQWLEQILRFEKAKAEIEIIQNSRREINDRYVFFAPVGSTIKRIERMIDFNERNYLATLKSYHDALMRKKNLEMTSASLKVLNPPAYPISQEPTNRKLIVIIVFFASLSAILIVFLLIEFLDQTLRDKMRAERVTGGKVLGAFSGKPRSRYLRYSDDYIDISTQYLSNIVLGFFTSRKEGYPYILNLLSTDAGDGKSYMGNHLLEYWGETGMKVKIITWEKDFDPYDSKYLLAQSVSELYDLSDVDVLIVEYPNLKEYNVPNKLIQEANLNLLVTRVDRAWKDYDRQLYVHLKKHAGDSPLYFYLTKTDKDVTEMFTGMLPPYTYFRRLVYKLSRLGITEKNDALQASEFVRENKGNTDK